MIAAMVGYQGEVQDTVGREMLGGKDKGEHRDEDQAAADTQQAGKETHDRTQQSGKPPTTPRQASQCIARRLIIKFL